MEQWTVENNLRGFFIVKNLEDRLQGIFFSLENAISYCRTKGFEPVIKT